MRELIELHPRIMGILGGLILSGWLAFLAVCLELRMARRAIRRLEHPELKKPAGVVRPVISYDMEPGSIVRMVLSCGHEDRFRLMLPITQECPVCTREVAELEKMAGGK